jgi:hypothetical protein
MTEAASVTDPSVASVTEEASVTRGLIDRRGHSDRKGLNVSVTLFSIEGREEGTQEGNTGTPALPCEGTSE